MARSRKKRTAEAAPMPRAWVRLGAVVAVATGLGFGVMGLLLSEDEPVATTKRSSAQRSPQPYTPGAVTSARPPNIAQPLPSAKVPKAAPVSPIYSAQLPRPEKPTSMREVANGAANHQDLAAWVQDKSLDPSLRYSALRRLEKQSAKDAIPAAIGCLEDTAQLIRLNAIAVLSRSDDPRAKEALARIDPQSQRLAQALVARR